MFSKSTWARSCARPFGPPSHTFVCAGKRVRNASLDRAPERRGRLRQPVEDRSLTCGFGEGGAGASTWASYIYDRMAVGVPPVQAIRFKPSIPRRPADPIRTVGTVPAVRRGKPLEGHVRRFARKLAGPDLKETRWAGWCVRHPTGGRAREIRSATGGGRGGPLPRYLGHVG